MPQLGDTVEVRVIDSVVAALNAIHSRSGDYNSDPCRVYRMYGNIYELPELPAIVVVPLPSPRDHECPNGVQRVNLRLSIGCAMPVHQDFDTVADDERLIRHLANDVEKALRADHTRGGLALDTHIDVVDIFEGVQGDPLAAAEITVTIPFRHLYADPTQAI